MDQITATRLKVEAFARGVSADQNPDRLLVIGRVEGDLDPVAFVQRRLACEADDPALEVDLAAAELLKAIPQLLD